MKKFITKTTLLSSKIDSQTLRVLITLGSLIIFSLIAGAPADVGTSG